MSTPHDPTQPPGDADVTVRQEKLSRRLDDVRRRVGDLQTEVGVLQRDFALLARSVGVRTAAAPPAPATAPVAAPPPRRPAAAAPARQTAPAPPSALRVAADRLVTADYSDLFGARVLAWVGGATTALGVVLMFVFAANRGWLGPELRVALGALASLAVFATGLWMRRRFGTTYAALGAVGAGIAGGYATLLASAVLYEQLNGPGALTAAAAIAAVGAATAIVWHSELIAGIGLIGAMLVPVAAAADIGFTALGTAFVALVLAAATAVGLRLRWLDLMRVAFWASFPQIGILLVVSDAPWPTLAVLAAVFGVLYAGAAVLAQRAVAPRGLDSLSASLVLAAASVGTLAATLLPGEGSLGRFDLEGLAAAGVAVAFGAVGAVVYGPLRSRQLGALFAAVALALGGHALAELLSGRPLAVALALQAALLAWLAHRVADRRFQVASVLYLGAATVHALALDAPYTDFTEPTARPAAGAVSVVAAALAAVAAAHWFRGWKADDAPRDVEHRSVLARDLAAVRDGAPAILTVVAAAELAYAGALAVLGIGQWIGEDVVASFEWSHVTISVLVAATGLGLLGAHAVRRSNGIVALAIGAFLLAAVKVGGFDLDRLTETPRGVSALAVGAILAVGAFGLLHRSPRAAELFGPVLVGVAAVSEVIGALTLTGDASWWHGTDADGVALLALGAWHATLARAAFARRNGRNHSAAQGIAAVVLAAGAIHQLLSGNAETVALAGAGAVVAGLAVLLRERRLLLAAVSLVGLAAYEALTVHAPPGDLLVEQAHPGAGVPALLGLLVGAVAVLVAERRTRGVERSLPPTVEEFVVGLAPAWAWATGATALYTASLALLEAGETVFAGSVADDFQRGHTAVSAFWALVGVALLHAGLARSKRSLRAAGLLLLGATLVKIFAYDLAALSAAARAASFLAVGVLILLAGFFYQRLAARSVEAPVSGDAV